MAPKLTLDTSVKDAIIIMSEGNPGAINVMMSLLNADYDVGVLLLLDMDDMNLRGSRIWIAFKDHCGSNLAKFIDCVHARDAEMVKTVNKEQAYGGPIPYDRLVVTHREITR